MGKSKVEIGIPAAFLAHFYEKPAMWWVFWWRCFADLNDGGGQVTYSQPVICSWLGVSRSSLRRIVDFGVKFGGAEQLVDSSWTGGKLTISVLDCGRKQFADSSLNLVLRAFLPNRDNRISVITELHTEIDKRFAEAGIEVAFPQRDIHIRSGSNDERLAQGGDAEDGWPSDCVADNKRVVD